MGCLKGKKAFITGAEQGIGFHSAKELIKAGCDIYIHYFSGTEGPEELVAMAKSLGQKATYGYADLRDSIETKKCGTQRA